MKIIKNIPPIIWLTIVTLVALPSCVLGILVGTLVSTIIKCFMLGYVYVDEAITELTRTATKFLRNKKWVSKKIKLT